MPEPESSKPTKSDHLYKIVVVLFLLSGFSSLIYQVVWTRMLVLIFGATTFATATVLAIFMGGLALGSFIAGRYCDRLAKPLLWYGILEGVIGVWALIAPSLFTLATPIYKMIWLHTHASLIPFSLLRFLATCVILIVPTTCMGATLPLLSKFVTESLASIGGRVGSLYSVNTFGAVCGAVLTGFFILPILGLNLSTWIAAGINFVLLAAVLMLSTNPQTRVTREPEQTDAKPVSTVLPVPVIVALICFAVSGGIAMIYEVCWTRTLLMVIGSSTYAFTVMLASFLIGIFLGSFISSLYVDRAKQPFVWFAILQLLVGVFTLHSMYAFNQVPYWNIVINSQFPADDNIAMIVRFFLAGIMLIPITTCLGAIFPVVVKCCTQELSQVGRSVGSLYAANTVGAIFGAFLAGFVCLPLFGAEKTLLYCSVLNFWLALALILGSTKRLPVMFFATAACLVVSALVFLMPELWDKKVLLNAQAQRRRLSKHGFNYTGYEDWRKRTSEGFDIKYWKDGPCSNVGILYHIPKNVTILVTNGHADASDSTDTAVQSLLSGFPLLLKPDAKDICIIGWGSGQTVGTACVFPVKSIEAVELEPAVIEASKFFHHVNHNPESDPRVHLQYNDGRNFLLATDEKFDEIISEPSNPWQAGVCNLFTKEYFQICHDRLKPHGLFSLWMQTAEVPPADLIAVISACKQVFPHMIAFYPDKGNIIIVAGDEALRINMPDIIEKFKDEKLAQEMAAVKIFEPESLVGHLIVGDDGFQSLPQNNVNSDDRNKLEYDVGKTYEGPLHIIEDRRMLASMSGSPWQQVDWGNIDNQTKSKMMANIAQDAANCEDMNLAMAWAVRSNQLHPNEQAYIVAGTALMVLGKQEEALKLWQEAIVAFPKTTAFLELHALALSNMNRKEEARKEFEKAIAIDPESKNAKYLLAGTYSQDLIGKPFSQAEIQVMKDDHPVKVALHYLSDLAADEKFVRTRPNTLFLAAQANFRLGHISKAVALMEQYVKPNSVFAARQYLEFIKSYPHNAAGEAETPTALPQAVLK